MQILVIYGGKIDRDSSLASAKAVISGLNKENYHVVLVEIASDFRWFSKLKKWTEEFNKRNTSALRTLKSGTFIPQVVAFPLLQGKYGEDGTIQGFLDTMNIPYIGSEVIGAALSMDKIKIKELLRFHHLPILPFYTFTKTSWDKNKINILKSMDRTFKSHYPLFIKPCNSTCSIGVSKANKRPDIRSSVKYAFKYGEQIIVEKGLNNLREIEVFIVANSNNLLRCLFCGEVIVENMFQDYKAKHLDERKLIIPTNINDALLSKIKNFAFQAFQAINCVGYARIDFFIEDNYKPYINEVTANPAFNKTKKYFESMGKPELFNELLDELIRLAITKWYNKQEFLEFYI